MKKIDLHIHTFPSNYERNFDFSIDTLIKYIEINKLDIVAITNHNLFNKEQFEKIANSVNCTVLPGVEVDIESSHMLVIAAKDKIEELNNSCSLLNNYIHSDSDSISYEDFINVFPNYRDYILIPHIKKKPSMKSTTIEKFGNTLNIGEVKSAKKFESTQKEETFYAPVLFSDIRMEDVYKNDKGIYDFPSKNTYVDINTVEFSVLKNALSDKNKVFLSENKKADEFSYLADGTTASTKLNVIIGKRSSGKTYNLKHIYSSADNKEDNIKYIEQFSLTGKSEESKFKDLVKNEQQKIISNYLEPLRKLTDRVLDINNEEVNNVDKYLTSLKEFATNQSLQDSYSKTKLFNEIKYDFLDNFDTKKVITALSVVLDSEHNKDLINKYIDRNQIITLINELVNRRRNEYLEYKLKQKTDTIVTVIKNKLTSKSSMVNVSEINLYKAAKDLILVDKYNNLIKKLKTKDNICELDVYRFKLLVEKNKFDSVSDVKRVLSTTIGINTQFTKHYEVNPFMFIKSLEAVGIDRSVLYKSLISFNVKVINEQGNELSGGERAEYNLLREIKGSDNYDILLLDEPEASFDNPFIKDYIIEIIKEISNKTTVFITTHNNSLGMLMKPNKIIYTANENNNFKVYTGEFGCKQLITVNNDSKISYDTIMEVMEAGTDAYEKRRDIYETFKD